jgi:hypothetical protein
MEILRPRGGRNTCFKFCVYLSLDSQRLRQKCPKNSGSSHKLFYLAACLTYQRPGTVLREGLVDGAELGAV